MKESAFRTSVHRHLPASLHKQPILAGMMGTAGTADTYYDGKSDLWVEYKCTKNEDYIPVQLQKEFMPNAEQSLWLDRRYRNGGNAIVIVGFKLRGRAHGVILESPSEWAAPPSREWLQTHMRTAAELGAYIVERTNVPARHQGNRIPAA